MIKNVVLEVLSSSQKNQVLEEAGSRPQVQEAPPTASHLQGEAELAYLTHEGLFISDALNEAQQQVQDQSSVLGSRTQQGRADAAGSDSAPTPEPAETCVGREQCFM